MLSSLLSELVFLPEASSMARAFSITLFVASKKFRDWLVVEWLLLTSCQMQMQSGMHANM